VSAPALPRAKHVTDPLRSRRRWAGSGLLIVVAGWSFAGTGVSPRAVVEGREGAGRLVHGLLRPETSSEFLHIVGGAAVETLQISVAGLVLGAFLGLPLAAVAAGNVGAPPVVRQAARTLAAVLRGVPELLWALVFVATVGLGPAAGVYALALHGAGLLAKLCSEQFEAVPRGPVEAIELTGAGRPAVMLLAIAPQARTGVASLVLYQWECNIRTATVVGFVGAGGIGQALDLSLRLFRYAELSTLVLAVLALILGVDGLSRIVRRRLGDRT
jgi:phosphonate transport system permease protein